MSTQSPLIRTDTDSSLDLLREDHPLYDQRGAATIVRMRGWVLLAMARAGLSDAALIFVLEELDTGVDAYLVAAAARALRSYPRPTAALAPFAMRALTNIRYRDEPVSFDNYGEYAVSTTDTTPVRELLATLAWLGPHARGALHELESLRASSRFPRKLRIDVDRAMRAIRSTAVELSTHACCVSPSGLTSAHSRTLNSRPGCESIESIVFEDHQGRVDHFQGILPWAAVHRRLFLYALRQSIEVLAHGHEARPNSETARGTGACRPNTHCGDYL